MPLTPAFSVSQSGLTPNAVTCTDTSSGTDINVSQRRVFFQTAQGTYLVESGVTTEYNPWPLANVSQSFVVLQVDESCAVIVQWLDVSNAVLYTLTQVFCFPQNNKNNFYQLIQQQALTPSIVQDSNYFSNMATYWMYITGAIQAIEIGADVGASQGLLNKATYMMQNASKYF